MTVKELHQSLHLFPDMKSRFVVKPLGPVCYFNSDNQNIERCPIVAAMEVESWAVFAHRRNSFTVVVVVAHDEIYEYEQRQRSEGWFESNTDQEG